jgi:hypothetical protein
MICTVLHNPAGGRQKAVSLYDAETLIQFRGDRNMWSHNASNTTRWMALRSTDLKNPYQIQYEHRYEPYVIIARDLAPWADERFVGYGGNKIAYINQLHGLNFKFHVHPSGFVVHVPHPRSEAARFFLEAKREGNAAMAALRLAVQEEIANGGFVPMVAECKDAREAMSENVYITGWEDKTGN